MTVSYTVKKEICVHRLIFNISTTIFSDAGLDFTQAVYNVGEGDGTVDVCMELTPPSGGMECEVVVNLVAADNKAGKNTENNYG